MNDAPFDPAALLPTSSPALPATSAIETAAAVVLDGATVSGLVIPVIEETATVTKRRVDTGRALRVRKLVHHDDVTVDSACAVEQVQVERVAVDRVLDGPVSVRHEGDVMVVPVVEERLVTVKQLVLVEEIRITRSSRILSSALPVTLRREEVIVERFDPDNGQWQAVEEPAAADTPTRR